MWNDGFEWLMGKRGLDFMLAGDASFHAQQRKLMGQYFCYSYIICLGDAGSRFRGLPKSRLEAPETRNPPGYGIPFSEGCKSYGGADSAVERFVDIRRGLKEKQEASRLHSTFLSDRSICKYLANAQSRNTLGSG